MITGDVVRALPIVVCIVCLTGMLALGAWQLRRHEERNADRRSALAASGLPALTTAAGESAWRTVEITGRFEGAPMLEGGAVRAAVPGYEVYAVFVEAGGARVLVDRGWLAVEGIEGAVASLPPADRVAGQVRPLRGQPDAPAIGRRGGAEVWGPGATRGMAMKAGAVALVAPAEEPPPRDDTSLHYALQWFGMAAGVAALGIYGATRPR